MWVGVVVSALLLVAWLGSPFCRLGRYGTVYFSQLLIVDGQLSMGWDPTQDWWDTMYDNVGYGEWYCEKRRRGKLRWMPDFGSSTRRRFVDVPLWIPLLVSLAVTSLLWQRTRTPRDAAACTSCGYSLRGLPAGSRCPECGKDAS
jgi:hypothetical protein